ncbi:hypothetical protein PUMCH_003377 [Australozyma saopauloensis]|uniref:ENTH domain-containing protein n=1 Tax=Australozyma saopauloensis TaxID=291208 RepID=A0AAX4HCK9_9ASCO|nr:hypothetical protein PUMCH_003377 [[Candida] saopauloensis]
METKVREATNNEPWGCPTTLMAQIAAGTYNYREREEILSFIFRRFTEKAANEWRQIYKSLQLLDYLIKNGSERIIDDIRANLSIINMLKSFHYIDSKGRDQGINVRNRSKNLVNLLNDDALVRLERKKARANSKKFGNGGNHTSSESYSGAGYSSGYGGGGSDEDFTNRVYGDGGVFGARYDDPADAYKNGATGGDNNFEEYDVEAAPSSSSRTSKPTTSSSAAHARLSALPVKSKPQPVVPEQDLLGDLMDFSAAPSKQAAPTAHVAADDDDDDDFDDFQSAPSLTNNTASLTNNLANLYVSQPAGGQRPQYDLPVQTHQQSYNQSASRVSSGPAKPSNDAFSSLFSSAKTKTATAPKATTTSAPARAAVPQHNNDDLFSDFTSNKPAAPAPVQKTAGPSDSGEVDLLSF